MHFYTVAQLVTNDWFAENNFRDSGMLCITEYENGRKRKSEFKLKPYLYVDSKVPTDKRTITGKHVQRIDFSSISELERYKKEWKDVDGFNLYGLSNFFDHVYVYLNDTFPGTLEYDPSLINVINIDIEVAADEGFPDIQEAAKPITAITVKKGETIIVFGLGDFHTDDERVTYFKCRDERELLFKFIYQWREWDVDVITGWNVEMFDVPYIINRIARMLSIEDAKSLSPYNRIARRRFTKAGFGEGVVNERPELVGISVLDYLSLYQKFTYSQQESYRLDNIAFVELGERKLDYSEYDGLMSLYRNDHQKFIEYNIRDVELVDRLEKKLGLLELVYAIAYDGKVNYIDSLTSVRMWDVIIHNHLLDRGIVVPNKNPTGKERQVEGAFVKDPLPGLHKWIVSFDLNSLYPHLIMQYNIGPDTYLGHIGKTVAPQDIINGVLDDPNIRSLMKEKNASVCGSGAMYTKDFRGFLPTLMEKMYQDRVVFKKKMLEYKQMQQDTGKDYSSEISKADNMQMAKKIQLNSAYGALGNEFFRWFDIKYAESITLSGQLSIRWMEKHINDYMNKLLKTNGRDYVIACDTDSMYITLDALVEHTFGTEIPSESKVIDWMDKAASQVFEPFIDKCYAKLAETTNAYEQKMIMKREALADKGVWTAKKRYALHVFDMEGVRYKEPYLKIMGLETQRSSIPAICRDQMKKAIKLIMEKDEQTLMQFVSDFRKKYMELPFEDVAFPRGCKGLSKYRDRDTIYAKATPIHVRGALMYNHLLKKESLENNYNPIYEGDKVKFCYMKLPNPIRENVFAVASVLPKQFGLEKYIDYDMMFEKSFIEPMKSITEIIDWKLEKGQATLEDFF